MGFSRLSGLQDPRTRIELIEWRFHLGVNLAFFPRQSSFSGREKYSTPWVLPEAQRSVRRENFAIFLFSAGDLVLKIYSFGILRGFLASYVELRILVFLMEYNYIY